LRRFSLSTGFLNRDDLRNSGDEEDRPPFGDEVGIGETPSGTEKGRPPFGEERGRFIVRGDRKEDVGLSKEGSL
jgi:hypothetical protein